VPWPHTGPDVHGTASGVICSGGITCSDVGTGSHSPTAGSPTEGSARRDQVSVAVADEPGAMRTVPTVAPERICRDSTASPSLRARANPEYPRTLQVRLLVFVSVTCAEPLAVVSATEPSAATSWPEVHRLGEGIGPDDVGDELDGEPVGEPGRVGELGRVVGLWAGPGADDGVRGPPVVGTEPPAPAAVAPPGSAVVALTWNEQPLSVPDSSARASTETAGAASRCLDDDQLADRADAAARLPALPDRTPVSIGRRRRPAGHVPRPTHLHPSRHVVPRCGARAARPGIIEDVTTILLADDEAAITDNLAPLLTRAGFDVVVAHDGEQALRRVQSADPDLVVLDVMMPGLDGRAVLRRMRSERRSTPVILLTQVGESSERAMALEEGADDYLNKPFDPQELVARIRAVLRRREGAGGGGLGHSSRLRSGSVVLDRVSQRVLKEGREVVLTPRATALLSYLMTHPDEVMTRERLLEAVWGWTFQTSTRSVDTRIAELRRELEEDSGDPRLITTVLGSGYRFSGRVESA
jgi:DNA-binding response OmpR family regulator